jgi:hypothetical protein
MSLLQVLVSVPATALAGYAIFKYRAWTKQEPCNFVHNLCDHFRKNKKELRDCKVYDVYNNDKGHKLLKFGDTYVDEKHPHYVAASIFGEVQKITGSEVCVCKDSMVETILFHAQNKVMHITSGSDSFVVFKLNRNKYVVLDANRLKDKDANVYCTENGISDRLMANRLTNFSWNIDTAFYMYLANDQLNMLRDAFDKNDRKDNKNVQHKCDMFCCHSSKHNTMIIDAHGNKVMVDTNGNIMTVDANGSYVAIGKNGVVVANN